MNVGPSVIDLLLRDHQKTRQRLEEFETKSKDEVEDYFCNLREELIRHEIAEELIVYPVFRKNVEDGGVVADACIGEQTHAEMTLAEMEREDLQSDSFRARFDELRQAVIAHAKHEESEVFPALHTQSDLQELIELGVRYEKALDAAPPHPHPHALATKPGNQALDPVSALVERIRDAMRAA